MKKTIKIFVLVLILILSLVTAAFAGIPEKSDSFYVADYANVIDSDTEDYIVKKNGSLEGLCGGQIVVVTVDFLDGMDIEDYAYKIFNDWGIGSKDENNGVLLLLAIGEENYWCMQGKGLENKITSADIDDMLWDYLEDDFAAGDYDAGVKSFFDEMYSEVSAIYEGDTDIEIFDEYYDFQKTADIMEIFSKVIMIVVVLFIFITILKITNTGRSSRRYDPYDSPSYPRKKKSRPIFFGGSGSSGSSYRPSRSSSRTSSRSSSRSSSRPRSSGGGGRSRGGGAGRRGR